MDVANLILSNQDISQLNSTTNCVPLSEITFSSSPCNFQIFFGMVVPDDGKRYCLVLGVPRSLGAPDLLYLLQYAYIIYTYMVIPAKIDTRIVMNDIPILPLKLSIAWYWEMVISSFVSHRMH